MRYYRLRFLMLALIYTFKKTHKIIRTLETTGDDKRPQPQPTNHLVFPLILRLPQDRIVLFADHESRRTECVS